MQVLLILFMALWLTGCEKIALLTTPKKKPQIKNTELSNKAQRLFWETLHTGTYQQIPQAEFLLTAAYLENPHNPKLASLLGFLHTWQITERQRLKTQSPTIVNSIILAKKYFQDAIELNPYDARTQGFLGDVMLIAGQVFQDQREQVKGYYQLKYAIGLWPEFNYFTAGYPMSTLAVTDDLFRTGLRWQWQTLSLCAGKTIDQTNPNFSAYMQQETHVGVKRACWNSWIAPHNFEGFFLNMGDMLVKKGDWQTAITIYQNAKLSRDYDKWPFKSFLENRIRNAKENVRYFRDAHQTSPERTILFNSGYGCVICHQSR